MSRLLLTTVCMGVPHTRTRKQTQAAQAGGGSLRGAPVAAGGAYVYHDLDQPMPPYPSTVTQLGLLTAGVHNV